MRILAIETSDQAATIAVLAEGELLTQRDLTSRGRSARTLAPGIQQLLQDVDWKPRDVQLVAVSTGPGSFTGLRLGVMTAKSYAYAVGAKILGIGTPDVVAARVPVTAKALAVAIDAQRGEVYCRRFRGEANVWMAADDVQIMTADAWLATLQSGDIVSGPALTKLARRIPASIAVTAESLWHPDAATVGQCAARHHAAGQADDVWTLAPHYLRRSAAEEKWDSRAAD